MKKALRTIFHGLRHEHAPGKLETLAKLRDTFEIVAAVDDLASTTPTWHATPPAGPDGVLGEIVHAEADMNFNAWDPAYADYVSSFKAGVFYNLACHEIDLFVPMMQGDLVRATLSVGDAPGDPPGSRTRCAAMLEWPESTVFLRTCSHVPQGMRRRLRVEGSNGTLELQPIECFSGRPLKVVLHIAKAAGPYVAGLHEFEFGPQTDRYAGLLLELAAIVRGEKPNPVELYDHDLKVHDTCLRACGLDLSKTPKPRRIRPPRSLRCEQAAMLRRASPTPRRGGTTPSRRWRPRRALTSARSFPANGSATGAATCHLPASSTFLNPAPIRDFSPTRIPTFRFCPIRGCFRRLDAKSSTTSPPASMWCPSISALLFAGGPIRFSAVPCAAAGHRNCAPCSCRWRPAMLRLRQRVLLFSLLHPPLRHSAIAMAKAADRLMSSLSDGIERYCDTGIVEAVKSGIALESCAKIRDLIEYLDIFRNRLDRFHGEKRKT